MSLPPCQVCSEPARVVYQAKTNHPIPRCWDHAPSMHDAIALGWLNPDSDHTADRRDRMQA